MGNYNSISVEGGVPIKAWTKGVPVDPAAEQQLKNVAGLPFVFHHVAAMPDVHWGMGATVGSVIATHKAIIPAAVWVAIGCGMMAVRTTVRAEHLPDDLHPIRTAIEAAVPHGRTDNGGPRDRGAWGEPPEAVVPAWADLAPGFERVRADTDKVASARTVNHLGTLGTGNHFIELCLDEAGALWVMLHSGSRGIGNRIGNVFIELAKKDIERFFIRLPDADLGTDRPSRFFLALRECGALARLLPELDALFGVPQRQDYHPEGCAGTHTMLVVDAAAGLTDDRATRFAALVHDLGKALTPPDRLPRHHGHEEAGATLVEPLVRRLAGPMAWAELGELTARWHGQVHKAAELRPGTLLKLLEAADAFHRPERLDALLTACQADYRGRTGKEDAPYPQANLVRRARDAAAAVTARALIASGHVPGPNLGDVLFQRRAEAIRDALIAR